MIGWELPPFNSGGLGVACEGLAKSLSKSEKTEEVLFSLPFKIPARKNFIRLIYPQRKKKINYSVFGKLFSPYSACVDKVNYSKNIRKNKNYFQLGSLREEVFNYADFIYQNCADYDFDIIHAHDWLCFPAAVKAREKTGKPFIAHIHATEFDRCAGDNINFSVYEIEKEGLERADGIIAISQRIKDILINKYGISENKIELIHNGIDKRYFQKNAGKNLQMEHLKKSGNKVVLYVGRLTVQKGIEFLIRAAKEVISYDKKVCFVIAGSGELRDKLISLAAELGISDKVFFPGFLRGEKLAEAYKSADVLVMPSVSEPFGLIPLESLINGTPVIISKQSGVSEVLINSLKVDFWDTKKLADMILAATQYQTLRGYLKDNGQKEVNGINWEIPAGKCLDYYAKFI
jgi:glycosyltransferase involved in cell wall biosynthesis